MIELLMFFAMLFGNSEARGRRMDHAPQLKAIGPRRCDTAACREDGF